MTLELVVRAFAETEISEAYFYFEKKRQGLGSEFLDRLDEVFVRIRDNPEMYALVSEGIRKVRLRQFPYVVGYHLDGGTLVVLGVLHGSRNPSEWLDRLK